MCDGGAWESLLVAVCGTVAHRGAAAACSTSSSTSEEAGLSSKVAEHVSLYVRRAQQ